MADLHSKIVKLGSGQLERLACRDKRKSRLAGISEFRTISETASSSTRYRLRDVTDDIANR
jgi:hypothetical protein